MRCSVGRHQCHQSQQQKPDICLASLPAAQLAALWDSWAPALQPAAHLIFLYSIVVLFILHFPPYIFIFIFYIQFSYSIKRSPVAHDNIRCQIKVQVTQ